MKIFGFNRFNQWHYANKVEQYLSKISLDEVVDAINENPDVCEITPSENFTISNDCNVRVYKKDDVYAIYINAIRIGQRIQDVKAYVECCVVCRSSTKFVSLRQHQ